MPSRKIARGIFKEWEENADEAQTNKEDVSSHPLSKQHDKQSTIDPIFNSSASHQANSSLFPIGSALKAREEAFNATFTSWDTSTPFLDHPHPLHRFVYLERHGSGRQNCMKREKQDEEFVSSFSGARGLMASSLPVSDEIMGKGTEEKLGLGRWDVKVHRLFA